jgi:hypothetical protein
MGDQEEPFFTIEGSRVNRISEFERKDHSSACGVTGNHSKIPVLLSSDTMTKILKILKFCQKFAVSLTKHHSHHSPYRNSHGTSHFTTDFTDGTDVLMKRFS